MINELERIWEKVVIAYLKGLSHHLSVLTEENHEKYQPELPISGPRFEPKIS
jgi:hypothetical protein